MNSTTTTQKRWVEHLERAWRHSDATAIAALFAGDATYRRHPFQEPLVGRAAITASWEGQLHGTALSHVRFGESIVDGDRAAVEWWAINEEGGGEVTSTGSLFLNFADGQCVSLREVWMEELGRRTAYPGWGS